MASAADIEVLPLGAGQDVGRSCVVVSVGGSRIMFDCGMHMGYNDARRFPDFSFLLPHGAGDPSASTSSTGAGAGAGAGADFTGLIDAVVITHFHLDHCGGLVYFTEMCGYDGPIYMTAPTKAIAPILLEDYRKIAVERRGLDSFFTSADIKNCMKKVITVGLHETVAVNDALTLKGYYAGHVLGAAMFLAESRGASVLYTGDYNMTPDRHLGAAWVDACRPSVLITESTYATTIRDSKRAREGDFLKQVHEAVARGGKVLIPVFALGRAQELCILLDTYWERMGLGSTPIYFSAGLTAKANMYYKLFIPWTNQKIKESFVKRNMFEFAHISEFEREFADAPGPCVLFATPGMLHAGTSLAVFKKWAHSAKNLVILPGYCVKGTVGAKLLAGQTRGIDVDASTIIDVKMQVSALSFSAHADAKGILQLIDMAKPQSVVLVHGEKRKMDFLKTRIAESYAIPAYNPPNGEALHLQVTPHLVVDLQSQLVADAMRTKRKRLPRPAASSSSSFSGVADMDETNDDDHVPLAGSSPRPTKRARPLTDSTKDGGVPVSGVLVVNRSVGGKTDHARILAPDAALQELGVAVVPFDSTVRIPAGGRSLGDVLAALGSKVSLAQDLNLAIDPTGALLSSPDHSLTIRSAPGVLVVSWAYPCESLALRTLRILDVAPAAASVAAAAAPAASLSAAPAAPAAPAPTT